MIDSVYMSIGGWFILAVGLIGGVVMSVKFITKRRYRFDRLKYAYFALMATYPIGLGFKITSLGPDFVRFHLGDIGFPLFAGLITTQFATAGYMRGVKKYGEPADVSERVRARVSLMKFGLTFGLILSYGYEAGVGYLYSRTDVQAQYVGRFDFIDIAMYTLGAVGGFTILHLQSRIISLVASSTSTPETHRTQVPETATEAARREKLAQREQRRANRG